MADPLDIFSLSAGDFNAYLQEAAQYSEPSQIDFLRREYVKRNSLSGLLDTVGEAGLEGKNVSSMLPIAGPAGMSLLDAARSGKLQTRFKDYVTDAVGALVGGIENPGMALKGLLADDEMLGAAMQTAGTAMLGGGAAANAVRPSASAPVATANANASVGALVLSQHARAKPELADILAQNGVDPANINAAPIQRVQAALETATARQILDPRSANSILQGFARPELEDFYANASKSAGAAGLLASDAPMIAHHNTTLEGISAARDLGGIPMPSIAVSNANFPTDKYGDISLLMSPDKIDPKSGVNVFAADGFTGTQPYGRLEFIDENQARAAFDNDPDFGHMGSSWLNSVDDMSDANYYMKFAQLGRDNNIGNPKDFTSFRDYANFVIRSDKTTYEQAEKKSGLQDYGGFRRMIPPSGDPYTPSGKRRDNVEATLGEVFKRMKQRKANTAGAYSLTGSPGLLRAVVSDKFKSIPQIQKKRGLLMAEGNDFQDVAGAWDSFSYDEIGDLAAAHFEGRQRFAEDYVVDLATGKDTSWANATPEARSAALKSIERMREKVKDMPTEYFEAKTKDVKQLSDFDAALVPKGSKDAIEMLKRQGIDRVLEYGDGFRGGKTRAQLMQEQYDLLFSNANPLAGLLAMQQPQQRENRGLLQ